MGRFIENKFNFLRYFFVICFFLGLILSQNACFSFEVGEKMHVSKNSHYSQIDLNKNGFRRDDTLTLGGGCFWCMEAIFQQMKGVISVSSGYSGGYKANPTYEEVCSGQTGHAEVIQIIFDEDVINMYDLLQVFFSLHDPTTLNQQGADVGEQYRSVIFYRNRQQRDIASSIIKKLDAANIFDSKVVTQVVAFGKFYPAEDYHQNYYNRNKSKGYCRAVIVPKLEKFEKLFMHLRKKE